MTNVKRLNSKEGTVHFGIHHFYIRQNCFRCRHVESWRNSSPRVKRVIEELEIVRVLNQL